MTRETLSRWWGEFEIAHGQTRRWQIGSLTLAVPRRGFGESSLDLQFSVWAKSSNFLDLRNSIQRELEAAFDRAGVEIPSPHRALYTGSVTEPMPVRVVRATDRAGARAEAE